MFEASICEFNYLRNFLKNINIIKFYKIKLRAKITSCDVNFKNVKKWVAINDNCLFCLKIWIHNMISQGICLKLLVLNIYYVDVSIYVQVYEFVKIVLA